MKKFFNIVSPIIIIILIGTGAYLIFLNNELHKDAPKDIDGHAVSISSEDKPDSETIQQMRIEETIPENSINSNDKKSNNSLHIKVDSVGMDVPVAVMSEVNNNITPPGYTKVYYIRDKGAPLNDLSQGTLYMATHSVKNGKAPGNYLIDIQNKKAKVKKGDSIQLGNKNFIIDETMSVEKSQLPNVQEIWSNKPNRLVLITCLQREQGKSLNNIIIIAHLEE